jgi:hypothetical protein
MAKVSVRSIVDDVSTVVTFYTEHLHFSLSHGLPNPGVFPSGLSCHSVLRVRYGAG